MAKVKTEFICEKCGASHLKWSGQCAYCGVWNSLKEITCKSPMSVITQSSTIQKLTEVIKENTTRFLSGFSELDRSLGGGLVKGSVVLIGGDPGIGKSTLILQVLATISKDNIVLYVSSEESVQQVSDRATRLGIMDDVLLLSETSVNRIIELIKKINPVVVVIDSIQTIATDNSNLAPGSISQVRDCAAQLTQFAKQTNTVILIIGHVTKDGVLAGPRILEHMVDTVLYFEGDAGGRYRIIRAVKNRFGAVNEISVFAMSDKGLRQVENPSSIFLSRENDLTTGSMVVAIREATRPLLIEVQALVDKASGFPKRVSVGMDQNRLALQLAILHKHGGIATFDQDVFINVVGGIKVSETASDLVVMLAIVSSLHNKVIPKDWIAFGEVGLTGEVRPVYNSQERLSEAQKYGFKLAIIPKANALRKPPKGGIKIIAIERLHEAIKYLMEHT